MVNPIYHIPFSRNGSMSIPINEENPHEIPRSQAEQLGFLETEIYESLGGPSVSAKNPVTVSSSAQGVERRGKAIISMGNMMKSHGISMRLCWM